MISAGIQPTLLLCDGAEKFSFLFKSLTGLAVLSSTLVVQLRIKVALCLSGLMSLISS